MRTIFNSIGAVTRPCTRLRVEKSGASPKFIVETEQETWTSPNVVVTAGQFGIPVMPEFRGAGEYKGTLVHSTRYKTGRAFSGKRVLVIGRGTAAPKSRLTWQSRVPSLWRSRFARCRPWHHVIFWAPPRSSLAYLLSSLPPRLADRIGMTTARVALGDLSKYGLTKPDWQPFSAKRIPIIDVGLVRG